MSSERRIQASRANGAKSHGPVTPEGRAKSSKNSLKHGLTAKSLILPGENPEQLLGLLSAVATHLQPRTDLEADLVTEIAAIRWRIRRCWSLESAAFQRKYDKLMDFARKWDDEDFDQVDPQTQLGIIYSTVADKIDKLNRHETRLHRQFQRTMSDLLLLRGALAPAPDSTPVTAEPFAPAPEPPPDPIDEDEIEDQDEPETTQNNAGAAAEPEETLQNEPSPKIEHPQMGADSPQPRPKKAIPTRQENIRAIVDLIAARIERFGSPQEREKAKAILATRVQYPPNKNDADHDA